MENTVVFKTDYYQGLFKCSIELIFSIKCAKFSRPTESTLVLFSPGNQLRDYLRVNSI